MPLWCLLCLLILPTAAELSAATSAPNVTNGSSSEPANQQAAPLLSTLQYYLWGYVGTVLSGLGIAGNLISIRVLLTPRMASSTSVYLIALASLDIVILLLFDICMGLPLVSAVFANLMQSDSLSIKVLYPLSLFIHMCSMYVTTCFTVERYISIRFPLRSASWCKRSRAVRVVVAILAFTALYNVPRALEKVSFVRQDTGNDNSLEEPNVNATTWSLQENGLYNRIYHGFMYSVFMYVLPLLVLAVSNALLVYTIRMSTRRAQGSIGGGHGQRKRQDRDRSISLMLASVVVVFVFCQTFALVDNLLAVAKPAQPPTRGQQAFYIIAQFMVVLNSSVNFLLYCFFGVKFRLALRSLFSKARNPTAGSLLNNSNLNNAKHNSNVDKLENQDPCEDSIQQQQSFSRRERRRDLQHRLQRQSSRIDEDVDAEFQAGEDKHSGFEETHRLFRLRQLRRLPSGSRDGESAGERERQRLLRSESAASSSVAATSV